jgi:FtsP/CotA-like multicopper oxidase with cupredoxin domain
MGHPMHLHGHKFWVLGAGDGMFLYNSIAEAPETLTNLVNPPYRDTTELPANGWTAIRYVLESHDLF